MWWLFRAVLPMLVLLGAPLVSDARALRSPIAVIAVEDGRFLAVADHSAGVLSVVDVSKGTLRGEVKLSGRPAGLARVSRSRLLVAEYDAGTLAEVDTRGPTVVRRIRTAQKAVGVAIARKRGVAAVADFGLHGVSVVDLQSGNERFRVATARHLYFVAITPACPKLRRMVQVSGEFLELRSNECL